ncbi:MAG: ribonuclease J [Candidatus Obscuribacterales bacterium]|nr:ribonuclease J [Candidatus Obscuribacterales bacterium]
MTFVAEGVELKYDRLCLIPLGGQSEIGRALWALSYAGELLLIDAGASYPGTTLPGVDLLLPNTNFLQANQDRITALLLSNGNEEHCGAVPYLLDHVKVPRIMAPRFVAALLSQRLMSRPDKYADTTIDTIDTRTSYQIGAFQVEWLQVNDAIADACGLKIGTPEGVIIYTSSFKLDQTPIDGRQMDIARLAESGDQGVTLLLSDSAGVESSNYTPSERKVARGFEKHIQSSTQRVIVLLPGTATLRLQVLFDLARQFNRKVVLYGEQLIQTAVAAAITGNLSYDRSIEAQLSDLSKIEDEQVMILATGEDGDAMALLRELADGRNKELMLKKGDTVIFSSEIYPGESRKMAMVLDQFLSLGVKALVSVKDGVHVSNHAGKEELKLMLALCKPRFFVPAIGEGRHIMHHAQVAEDFVPKENIFPLRNGEILEISNGSASVIGSVEAQAVFYNRGQEESVTAFSVSERRSLSMEGVLNLGILLNDSWELLQEPHFDGAALGFTQTPEWAALKLELAEAIQDCINKQKNSPDFQKDFAALKAAIRDIVAKAVRSRLSSKPAIQVNVHEFASSSRK